MKKLSKKDFEINQISKTSKIRRTVVTALLAGTMLMSCVPSDSKACTDSNSGDPLGDSGAVADPSDTTVVNDTGDTSGNGISCADSD